MFRVNIIIILTAIELTGISFMKIICTTGTMELIDNFVYVEGMLYSTTVN